MEKIFTRPVLRICFGFFLTIFAFPVHAAVISVNSVTDILADDGTCSLREAIIAANTNSASGASTGECLAGEAGEDTVQLPAGTYLLGLGVADAAAKMDTATSGDMDITENLVLAGAGSAVAIIDGNALDRVIQITPGVTANISGVTIQNGKTSYSQFIAGAGIFNEGNLRLSDSVVQNNQSDNTRGDGAGISNDGEAHIVRCIIKNNKALKNGSNGGGIFNNGNLTVQASTIEGNTCIEDGGGIMNDDNQAAGHSVLVVDSAIVGNSNLDDGGGIYSEGNLTVLNSTISQNQAWDAGGGIRVHSTGLTQLGNVTLTQNRVDSDDMLGGLGGGIYNGKGEVQIKNTLIVGNFLGTANPIQNECGADIQTGMVINSHADGHNLIGDVFGCPFTGSNGVNGDLVGDSSLGTKFDAALVLDPNLVANSPATHALIAGSPAVNAGNNTVGCTDFKDQLLTTDQRGVGRPIDTICDIGAYEFQPKPEDNVPPGSDNNPEPANPNPAASTPAATFVQGTGCSLVKGDTVSLNSMTLAFLLVAGIYFSGRLFMGGSVGDE